MAIIDESTFRTRAAQGLHAGESDRIFDPKQGRGIQRSDWDLNPEFKAELDALPPPRPAAVLIPVVKRAELTVILTQRPDHMSTHPGQISFPGGKAEKDDDGPVFTALREANEEIGLDRSTAEPLGFLDNYRTGTGFQIAPVVALIEPDVTLTIDPNEVAEAFEVPLAFLMDAANHEQHSRIWNDRERYYYAMPYGERYIWGATAGILKNLHERLFVT